VSSAFAIALLLPRSGSAQSGDEPAGYRQIIAEAITEFDAGNFVEAYTLFNEANKVYPNARAQRGVGMVAFELRRYSESVRALEQALASTTKRLDGRMRTETEQLLARARRYIARLELELTPRDAEVLLDGTPVLRGSGALIVDAGSHNLKVRADGHATDERVYVAEGGAVVLLRLNLEPVAREERAPTLGSAPSSATLKRRKLRPWVAGLGGAGLVVGAGFIAAAAGLMSKRLSAQETLTNSIIGTPVYRENVQAWRDTRLAPYVTASVGAALLTSSAIVMLVASERSAFPWWASLLSGVAGSGLAAWGVVELVRGGPCPDSRPDQSRCAEDLGHLDLGAVLLMSALPLLATSLTQLIRRISSPRVQVATSFDVSRPARSRQLSPQLHLTLHWF
jgi:hypothetical protein